MKKIFLIIVIGLILRVLLMLFIIHPDIRGHNLAAYLISQKGEVFSFYDYISKLPRNNHWAEMYHDGLFIYPPLAYLTLAVPMWVLGPIYPWSAFFTLVNETGLLKLDPVWPWLMFLLKLPLLIIETGGFIWLFKKINKEKRVMFTALWAFNIVILFSAYMMGQFDLVIGILIAISAVLSIQKPTLLSAILLGIAAGFKPFPLFLLPFLGTNLSQKIKYVLMGLFTYGLIIAPYLGSAGFRRFALVASQSDKLTYAKILLSGSQYLSLFWVGFAILLWFNYQKFKLFPIWGWFISVLLIFYSVTHWHPQWFTWASILLLWAWVHKKIARFPITMLIVCFFAILMLFEPSLNFGMFNINFDLFAWINLRFPGDELVSIIRAMFLATSLITVLSLKEA